MIGFGPTTKIFANKQEPKKDMLRQLNEAWQYGMFDKETLSPEHGQAIISQEPTQEPFARLVMPGNKADLRQRLEAERAPLAVEGPPLKRIG